MGINEQACLIFGTLFFAHDVEHKSDESGLQAGTNLHIKNYWRISIGTGDFEGAKCANKPFPHNPSNPTPTKTSHADSFIPAPLQHSHSLPHHESTISDFSCISIISQKTTKQKSADNFFCQKKKKKACTRSARCSQLRCCSAGGRQCLFKFLL